MVDWKMIWISEFGFKAQAHDVAPPKKVVVPGSIIH
jgi:hypothetical protein